MAAPTPVSAYLHSATMVKAGVFLLARLHPALAGTEAWFWLVSGTGLATLLVGAWAAIFQHDLKGLLAYSTISHLGLITLLFGIDEPLAVVAAVFHILNHATFKAGLFMSAGIVDHECGTRDMRIINGLGRLMPVTATLGIVAALAMAGVPLFNGFLSKEMFFAETLGQDGRGLMQWLLPAGATLAGLFSVAYSTRFVHDVFFNGEPVGLPKTPHEAPFLMRLPVGLLVAACIAVGLAPTLTAGPLLSVAAQASLHATPLPAYTLAIWHGFNTPLLMSLVAIVGGIALYAGLMRTVDLHTIVGLPLAWRRSLRDLFEATGSMIASAARAVTGTLENGRLRQYLLLLIVIAFAAGGWPFVAPSVTAPATSPPPLGGPGASAASTAVVLVGIAAALGAVLARRRRLVALLLVGAVGLVVCVAFVELSAPDLALTQLLVEVATVLLLMLALPWLPADSPPERRPARSARDAVVAIAVGVGTAALAWAMLGLPQDPISPYFLREALPLGGGANVVNVIIVDFRAFDTLGEITVLCIAALAMHALLSNFGPAARLPPAPVEAPPLMLQLVAGGVLPFTALIAAFLYLRGHNEPGGGFAAGLVLAIGLLTARLGQTGPQVTRLRASAGLVCAGAGLAVATLTGAASWAFGAPFLTSTYDYPWVPGIGAVPLASAAAFDLGVFLVVVGAMVAMLDALARLPGRAGR